MGRILANFADGTRKILIGMKFEDQWPAAGDADGTAEKCRAILAAKNLTQRRCAYQYIVPVGKIIGAITLAVVEIGNPGDHDFFGAGALLDKKVAISFTGHAEPHVRIAEARGR